MSESQSLRIYGHFKAMMELLGRTDSISDVIPYLHQQPHHYDSAEVMLLCVPRNQLHLQSFCK